MIVFARYITKEINPETRVSRFFDLGYYKEKTPFASRHLPQVTPQNRLIDNNRKELMALAAYGVGPSDIMKIIKVYKPILKQFERSIFKPYLSKCCIYYSHHIKELKRLIGDDFEVLAESLITYYENNKDNPNQNMAVYSEAPISIETAEADIRLLLNKLLMFTKVNVPENDNIKKLNIQEKEIKEKIMKCDDISILNEYYSQLLTILSQKDEYRKNLPNKASYKAIRCLQQCGFTEAAYKWLNNFPKK
jgi:hypothetical protein